MKVKFATSNPHKVREGNLVGKKFGMEFIQIKQSYPEIRALPLYSERSETMEF